MILAAANDGVRPSVVALGVRRDWRNLPFAVRMAEADDDDAYAWERRYERTWEDITVAKDGTLRVRQAEGTDWRLQRAAIPLDARRGVIRHVLIVWDISRSAGGMDGDLKPSRALAVCTALTKWVEDFFDQNPISRLGIVLVGRVKDSVSGVERELEAGAELWSQLSSSAADHVRRLREFADSPRTEGLFSLQNALELVSAVLMPMPAYGTKEVLLLVSSLATCDPGDVMASIRRVEEMRARCSVLELQAETHVCKVLAHRTRGRFAVICDFAHLCEELREHLTPPAVTKGAGTMENCLVQMGLPPRSTSLAPSLCACHGELTHTGHACSQCGAKHCQLPTCCVVCGLTLVSSFHLARSTRHLFPLPPFERVRGAEEAAAAAAGGAAQGAAAEPMDTDAAAQLTMCGACWEEIDADDARWRCERCKLEFCETCNRFMHDVLNNCPGCEALGLVLANDDGADAPQPADSTRGT